MAVLATAGHVDHGKSTLVRALTGIEPDRWAEERRRGMTIDLGYAWTTLPGGRSVAFVDVPGHERFIGNMLAGIGPVAAVLLVVAADEGWRAQTAEHLAAVRALGLTRGLLVITRTDLADPAPALRQAREHLQDMAFDSVGVSAVTGQGLPELRTALDTLVASLPAPDVTAPVRWWVDRSFSIRGSGTVVTGTLSAGTLRVGDELQVGGRRVTVRGLQRHGEPVPAVAAVDRVAVNLRGIATDEIRRGDALLRPGAWSTTTVADVRTDVELPTRVMLHVGTATAAAHVRPLADALARLSWVAPLPLVAGDRLVLQHPTTRRVIGGAEVLDAAPPELRRRGAAAARAVDLFDAGTLLAAALETAGALPAVSIDAVPPGAELVDGWVIAPGRLERWAGQLRDAAAERHRLDPLRPGLTPGEAVALLALPDRAPLPAVIRAAGMVESGGRIHGAGERPHLGAAEAAVRTLADRLRAQPFAAPERPDLDELGLRHRELATAAALGRLLVLADDVVLLPSAPALAMRAVAALPQPFTTSAARQAWATTRRVAVPLLEHLDGRGWTRRLDAGHREVIGGRTR
jgi:selenocysteine-specific elongation factor